MLTDAIVKELSFPADGRKAAQWIKPDYEKEDDPNLTCRGFGVKVMASGKRTFIVAYRFEGREKEFIIGDVSTLKVAEARKRARAIRQQARDGIDPQGARVAAREAPTVKELAERAVAEHFAKRRPRTRYDVYGDGVEINKQTGKPEPAITGGQLKKWIIPQLGKLKVADVRPVDIENLHTKVTQHGSPIRANRVVSTVSKLMSLAARWEMRAENTNPCKGAVERNVETKRERYVAGAELIRLTAALAGLKSQSAANALRLALLTGARIGEVSAARWDQFDLDAGTWTKESSDTKQKKLHHVPLSAPALQLLVEMKAKAKGPYVFPGRGGKGHITTLKTSWQHVRVKAEFDEPTRIHDLRHSLASILASGGASLPLIGQLLGHSNPATTARYSHLFLDPQRAAIDTAGAVIMRAKSAEVVPLRKKS